MGEYLGEETRRLIEKKILRRFEEHRDEEIQVALQVVADDLRAQGREDITYEIVRQVYMAVMMY